VLKMKPQEPTRYNFVRQALMLEVCKEKLKPIAGDWSKNALRRLRIGISLSCMSTKHFSFYKMSIGAFCLLQALHKSEALPLKSA